MDDKLEIEGEGGEGGDGDEGAIAGLAVDVSAPLAIDGYS